MNFTILDIVEAAPFKFTVEYCKDFGMYMIRIERNGKDFGRWDLGEVYDRNEFYEYVFGFLTKKNYCECDNHRYCDAA